MRLSERLQRSIKQALIDSFGDVSIVLFGSRADDTKRGGDIDIAIDSHFSREEFRKRRAEFFSLLLRQDFELDIDLIQLDDASALLHSEITKNGIELRQIADRTSKG